MKAFGLEIRKIGNIESLYQEVDLVLQKRGIKRGQVDATTQMMALAHSLQKMFKSDRYFDVCTIRNGADLCQVVIPAERMRVYQSIHCLSWSEMLPEFRQEITAMVLDDFRCILKPAE